MYNAACYNGLVSRLDKFNALKDHAWFSRSFKKLTQGELELARQFIAKNDGLDRANFEYAVNRMFLDRPKSKNFTVILDLVMAANV